MEITARELGYKNLINRKELGTVEVVGFNEEIIQYLHLDTIYYDEYSKFEAIPLTEEWLLKFGFEEVDYAGGCYNLGIVCIDTADFNCVVNGKWLDVKIQYVHQLQNLYYALTQTELTLTKLKHI